MDHMLKAEIERLVADLVAGRYADIEAGWRRSRLSEQELRTVVEEYGRTLVPLPNSAWDLVDEYQRDNEPHTVSVDVPLWTAEEGRSDLTLTLTATKWEGKYMLEVDDLHVL